MFGVLKSESHKITTLAYTRGLEFLVDQHFGEARRLKLVPFLKLVHAQATTWPLSVLHLNIGLEVCHKEQIRGTYPC